MNAFRPKGRSRYVVKVPTSTGWVNRPTGTRDGNTARKMQRMVDDLSPAELGAMDLLAAIRDKTLTLYTLYQQWTTLTGSPAEKVTAIRALLTDVDLLTKRAGWQAAVRMKSSEDTASHYNAYLTALVATIGRKGTLPRSAVTVEGITAFLAGLEKETGTKRKYHAGLSSFFGYCARIGVVPSNIMRGIPLPPAGLARDRHLSTEDAIRLADAQPSPYREFSALLHGTGIDVGVALTLRVRDVDIMHQEIRARGTKTHNRDRVAKVAVWAWSYVAHAIAGKLPDALLFDGVRTDDRARKQHNAACKALGIVGYTQRDARHTYAVRMVQSGVPTGQVGKQLGHKDAVMTARVYANYTPDQEERARWEAIAAARDAASTTKEHNG